MRSCKLLLSLVSGWLRTFWFIHSGNPSAPSPSVEIPENPNPDVSLDFNLLETGFAPAKLSQINRSNQSVIFLSSSIVFLSPPNDFWLKANAVLVKSFSCSTKISLLILRLICSSLLTTFANKTIAWLCIFRINLRGVSISAVLAKQTSKKSTFPA